MKKKAEWLRIVDLIIVVLLLANLLFLIKNHLDLTARKDVLIDFEKLKMLN